MNDYIGNLVLAFGAIMFLCSVVVFIRIMNADNGLEWQHLVSTRTADGYQRASWNEIGKGCGVMLCLWMPAVYAYSPKMEATGLATLMGVALLYLGSVSGYAATLRARQGATETTKVTEMAPLARTTETTLQTAPVAQEKAG